MTHSQHMPFPAFAVGTRLVVRYRLDVPGPHGETLTDALGVLTRLSESDCEIRTRKGIVTIALATVAAVKQVPPAPPRRKSQAH